MIPSVRFAVVLLAFGAMSGASCTQSSQAPANAAKHSPTGVAPRDIRIAATCDSAESPTQWLADTASLVLGYSRTSPLCVDGSDSVGYRPEYARLHVFKDGGATVDLECRSPATHDEFYRRNAGRQVVLLAGDSAVAIFAATAPRTGATCGRIELTDFDEAAALCGTFATHWELPTDDCFEICDGTKSVCIEVPPTTGTPGG